MATQDHTTPRTRMASGLIALTLVAATATGQSLRRDLVSIGDPIVIRAEAVASDADRRDQIRFGRNADHELLGQTGRAGAVWTSAADGRAAYGADEDVPEYILVRVFDAVFAIDPFVRLPQPDTFSEFRSMVGLAATRQLFGQVTLETDRTLYDRRRIDRVEEVFVQLESARQRWLRENGYYRPSITTRRDAGSPDGVTIVGASDSVDVDAKATRPQSGEWAKEAGVDQPSSRAADAGKALRAKIGTLRISRPFAARASIAEQIRRRYGSSNE